MGMNPQSSFYSVSLSVMHSNIHLSIVVKLNSPSSFNQLVSISPQASTTAAVAAEETTTEGQEGIAAPPLPFSYQHKQNLILCETDAVLTEWRLLCSAGTLQLSVMAWNIKICFCCESTEVTVEQLRTYMWGRANNLDVSSLFYLGCIKSICCKHRVQIASYSFKPSAVCNTLERCVTSMVALRASSVGTSHRNTTSA